MRGLNIVAAGRMVALVALALAAYAGPGPREFVYDDQFAIPADPVVTGSLPPLAAFTHDFWGKRGASTVGTYRPIAVLSFALDWRLSRTPSLFRASNVFWHVLLVLAVFLVWRRWLGDGAAFAASALMAVLGAPSEAVLESVGRADILCALWATIGLAAHRVAGWRGVAGGACCFALAVGSKETGVMAPVAWLALDWLLPAGALSNVARLVRSGAYAAVLAVYAAGREVALGSLVVPTTAQRNPLVAVDLLHRLVGAGHVFIDPYLDGILVPWHRLYVCGPPRCGIVDASDSLGWLGLLLVLGLAVAPLVLLRRSPIAAAGVVWFGLFFLPASNLLIPGPAIYGERLLYTPIIGLVVAVMAAARTLDGRGRRRALMALLACTVVANAVATRARRSDWNSQDALMRSVAQP